MNFNRRIFAMLFIFFTGHNFMVDAQYKLPTLEKIISVAIRNSPLVKTQKMAISKQEAEAKRNGKLWLQSVQLEVGSRYNTFFTTEGNIPVAGSQTGLILRFSLYDLFARKNIVERSHFEVKEAMERANQQEVVIRQAVIDSYYKVELNARLLSIASERVQSILAHQQLAEQEFKAGDIPISELSRVAQIVAQSKSELEKARADYEEGIRLLEALAGVSLTEIN